MAKSTKHVSTADRWRSIKRKDHEELTDMLDELREMRDTFEGAQEIIDSLEEKKLEAEGLVEFLKWIDPEQAAEIEMTAAGWNAFLDGVEFPDPSKVVEAFDELDSAIESFESLLDQDNYPGIGDERREAWDEVVDKATDLADALDEHDIDLEGLLTVEETIDKLMDEADTVAT
jgi:hypothetical protein